MKVKEVRRFFDLQMFANPNTQVTTQETLAPTMKVFYDTSLLENARNEHYFTQFGQKQPLPKNGGNQVEWRKFKTYAPAMTPLTEGVTPDGNKTEITKIVADLNQYGDYTTVSDRLQMEAVDPVLTQITEEHGAQAGDTIDLVTRNEVVSGTNVIYGGDKTSRDDITAADVLTPTLIDKAYTFLKKQKAPTIDGHYVAIIHPSVAYDLREQDGWLDVHKYAQPDEIFNGEIGMLHNVRFVETTQQKIWKNSTNVSVYATTFFGKDAWGTIDPAAESLEVIVKPLGSAGTADPLNQRGTVGWKATHAAKILYQERLVRTETGSAYSAIDEAN